MVSVISKVSSLIMWLAQSHSVSHPLVEPRIEDRHQDDCRRHQHPILEMGMDAKERQFARQPIEHVALAEMLYKSYFSARATAEIAKRTLKAIDSRRLTLNNK